MGKERLVDVLVQCGLGEVERAGDLGVRLSACECETVKTHLTRILAKLDLRDRVQLVVFAYENGLSEQRAVDSEE